MRLRRPSPSLVVAFLALAITLSGVAFATVPARDGDVHLCYSKKTGAVEVVDTQKDQFRCDQNWRGFVLDATPRLLQSEDRLSRIVAATEDITLSAPKATLDLDDITRLSVEEDLAVTAGKNATFSFGKDALFTTGGNLGFVTGKDTAISTGKKLNITAADEITFKTGDASITMKKDGTIAIKGKDISIQGSGKVSVKGNQETNINGSKVGDN